MNLSIIVVMDATKLILAKLVSFWNRFKYVYRKVFTSTLV